MLRQPFKATIAVHSRPAQKALSGWPRDLYGYVKFELRLNAVASCCSADPIALWMLFSQLVSHCEAMDEDSHSFKSQKGDANHNIDNQH